MSKKKFGYDRSDKFGQQQKTTCRTARQVVLIERP